ncbi:MAG: hypothetical protein ACKE51_06750 [Methylococcaceae bacterium]
MKLFNSNDIAILILILNLGLTGCATTQSGKNAGNKTPQDNHEAVLQKIDPLPVLPKSSTINITGVQTGRYSSIKPKPSHSQRELLQVLITVSIPDDIRNVGQAIRYLLKRSGYELVQPQIHQVELTEFFNKSLPRVHRRIGPMTLEDALITLTAPAFLLVDDPVRRFISYRLDDSYTGEML